MPQSDYDLALQCQRQYDGKILLQTVAGVVFTVVENDDAIDLIFRGTSDMADAKRDLEALVVNCPFGKVHGGAWEGITEAIGNILCYPPGDKLICTFGHSLGGMRASLAACELYRRGFKNLECVTFGCPRFGNAEAVAYLNNVPNRTYRNYNNLFEHDFFTTIPLPLVGEDYANPPNRLTGWSAPTAANEWKDEGILIEAHSLQDCYLPLVQRLCAQS